MLALPQTNGTDTMLQITQHDVLKLFSIDDLIDTGAGKTKFAITEILPDRIRIQPTEAVTPGRLTLNKLSAIVESIELIDPQKIEESVGRVLKTYQLKEVQAESYLYGMAKEYIKRRESLSEPIPESNYNEELEKEIEKSRKSTAAQRLERLLHAPKKPKIIFVLSKAYQRNPDVIVEVLNNAKGVCDNCGCKAPFIKAKDGLPYLEVHHRIPLANGGDDTVDNAIALCPNCHRKAHLGVNT